MASAAQIAANRANARKSTGPRTAEGKARSSRNNLRHGFRSAEVAVNEDDPAFHRMLAERIEYYQPVTPEQLACVHQIAMHWYRQFYLDQMQDQVVASGSFHSLGSIFEYRNKVDKQYRAAVGELRALQSNPNVRTQSAGATCEIQTFEPNRPTHISKSQTFEPNPLTAKSKSRTFEPNPAPARPPTGCPPSPRPRSAFSICPPAPLR